MEISLGFSPCPNDTFIFDALVHKKINTQGLTFTYQLADVETLNNWALKNTLQVTKLSYGVLPKVLPQYALLQSGSALGTGVGPLLIAKHTHIKNIDDYTIAIPGQHTTANLLFTLAYPLATKKVYIPYDEIENFVKEDKGLGVIIHENRFTYAAKGLHKIIDLGEFWETTTAQPIPLGGIVVSRKLDAAVQLLIDNLIHESIQFAYKNYPELNTFITQHAQEMSEEIMRKHIDLYVNNYSLQLGDKGKAAVIKLLSISNPLVTAAQIFAH